MDSNKKKSHIWEFLSVHDEDQSKAVCHNCQAIVSRGSKEPHKMTTANLVKHLKVNHPAIFKEFKMHEEAMNKEKSNMGQTNKINSYFGGNNIKDLNAISTPDIINESTTNNPIDLGGSLTKASTSGSENRVRHRSMSQPSIKYLIDKKSPWKIDDAKSKRGHEVIAEMICVDIQPYSIVENIGFQRVIKYFEERYVMPSRKYFTENKVPLIYNKLKNKLHDLLLTAKYISLTSDAWTSKNMESFVSLTAHWLSDDFTFNSAVLKCECFEGSHTAFAIGNFIKESLREWNIPLTKVNLLLRDNASNMIAAMPHCGLENSSLSCCIHTLQLCIVDKLFKQHHSVSDMLTLARNLATHFHHSSVASTTLKKIQEEVGVPEHQIKQDVCTRWDSTFIMLERLVEQKKAIVLYCLSNHKVKCLSNYEWELAETLVKVLGAFEKVTKEMSHSKASVSMVIPFITAMEKFLDRELDNMSVRTILTDLKNNFQIRFAAHKENKKLILATVLDPRFKLTFFLTSEKKAHAKDILIKEYMKLIRDNETEISSVDNISKHIENSTAENVAKKRKLSENDIWTAFFEYNLDENSETPSRGNNRNYIDDLAKCMRNINDYLLMTPLPRSDCPFNWWKHHKETFAYDENHKYNLASLAQQYLGSPPSSVASERLFSTAGNVYESKRTNLTGKHGEQLVFCHDNLRFFNFEY